RVRLEGRPQIQVHLSNNSTRTCVIARCKTGASHYSTNHFASTSITSPGKGEKCTERTVRYQLPRLQGADPHPVWIWSADRLSAHRGRDVSKGLFGDLHRTQPLGLADATCSVLCATASPVGACWCNSRIFGSRPRWQASGCSFAPTPGHQRQETDFLRPRILTAFQACTQETLPVRT